MNPENKQSVQTTYTLSQCPKEQSKAYSPTLAEWLDEWMETYKACVLKPRTAIVYKGIISLIKTCPESCLQLSDCTERNMQQLLNGLQKRRPAGKTSTYSRSILNKVRMMLIASFRTAKKEKILVRTDQKNIYSICYRKKNASYNNKKYFRFLPARELKLKLRDKIREGGFDSFKEKDYGGTAY